MNMIIFDAKMCFPVILISIVTHMIEEAYFSGRVETRFFVGKEARGIQRSTVGVSVSLGTRATSGSVGHTMGQMFQSKEMRGSQESIRWS